MVKITGTIAFIDAPTKPSETFTKQVFGIKVQGSDYGEEVYFEAVNDRLALLKNMKPGQLVQAGYTIRCTSSDRDGKVTRFTALRLVSLERLAVVSDTQAEVTPDSIVIEEPKA